jgi:uncharacterized protein (DUF952 family)
MIYHMCPAEAWAAALAAGNIGTEDDRRDGFPLLDRRADCRERPAHRAG